MPDEEVEEVEVAEPDPNPPHGSNTEEEMDSAIVTDGDEDG